MSVLVRATNFRTVLSHCCVTCLCACSETFNDLDWLAAVLICSKLKAKNLRVNKSKKTIFRNFYFNSLFVFLSFIA
jgi:hypothetical protein